MSTFKFLCLGSGSSGNCFYFQTDEGAFLIDAGVGMRKMKNYLNLYNIHIEHIKAVFLTHDHIDHSRCASAFSSKYFLPIYATEKVWKGIDSNPVIRKKVDVANRRLIQKNTAEKCCGCEIIPFSVPHDSNDNVGYFITYNGVHLTHITDAGFVTEEMDAYITQADQLILESNYDESMLRTGPYPFVLKQRISGINGHLSNEEAARIVSAHYQHLQSVWLCHLSENNNTPETALDTMKNYLNNNSVKDSEWPRIVALNRILPTGFFDLT